MDGPVFFGVRHLSPAAAFRLRQALDACRPQLILVEGPSDLNEQMHWLCHPETRFPAAILAYTHEPPVRTILYPLAIYSPELQAIHWAHEHQTECRFMDLPSGAMLALGEAVADEADPAESTEWVYRRMEQLTGEEHDTFWERNFEQIEDWQDFQAAVNLFGEQLRQTARDGKYRTAQTLVRDIMTRGCASVSPHEDCRAATRLMAQQQVRRLPVVEEGKLVGIISLADLARSQRFDMEAAQALGEISENIVRR